jgi:DNA-binding MarR family transcriptional regulator
MAAATPDTSDDPGTDGSHGIEYADTVGFLLSQIGFKVAAGFKEALARFEVDPREFAVLNMLGPADGIPQQTVSDLLSIPPSSLVTLIDHLEEAGLVERRPHASDRRVRSVILTPLGRERLAEMVQAAIGFNDRIRTGVGPDDEALLVRILHQIAASLGVTRGVHPGMAQDEHP